MNKMNKSEYNNTKKVGEKQGLFEVAERVGGCPTNYKIEARGECLL